MITQTFAAKIILAQAAAHLVTAYAELISEYRGILPLDLRIETSAPESYDELKANAKAGFLSVTPAFSETAIYGAAGNSTFRIFHDYGHLLYARRFETEDEIWLAKTQWEDIKANIPHEWRAICHRVYMRDTVGQSLFEHRTGAFPVDQKAFALEDLIPFLASWANNVQA